MNCFSLITLNVFVSYSLPCTLTSSSIEASILQMVQTTSFSLWVLLRNLGSKLPTLSISQRYARCSDFQLALGHMVYATNAYKVRDYIQVNTYTSKLYSDGNIYIYNEPSRLSAGLSIDQKQAFPRHSRVVMCIPNAMCRLKPTQVLASFHLSLHKAHIGN